jgi:hypothetical protein
LESFSAEQLGCRRGSYAHGEQHGDGYFHFHWYYITSFYYDIELDLIAVPGVAIYFMSPLWPYLVNTAVSLDSAPLVLIDLVDHSKPNVGVGPETVQSQVVWGEAALANKLHTLVISVGAGQPYAIVDALM